jgi:hypothetical protein
MHSQTLEQPFDSRLSAAVLRQVMSKLVILTVLVDIAFAFSPYGDGPVSGWSYYLESAREYTVGCEYKFISYPDDCMSIDQYHQAGANQAFQFEKVPGTSGDFYLQTSCGRYVSYPGGCSETALDTWGAAGTNQVFRIMRLDSFSWALEAVGRLQCASRFLSWPHSCSDHSIYLGDSDIGLNRLWHLHVAAGVGNQLHFSNSGLCADPFVWRAAAGDGNMYLTCTGGGGRPPLYQANAWGPDVTFTQIGVMLDLSGQIPEWTQEGHRWAPENVEIQANLNVMTYSDMSRTDGKHRVGWVINNGGPGDQAWSLFSSGTLDLGGAAGGEIDASIFVDDDGNTYVTWKSDDNAIGDTVTRLWGQSCSITDGGVTLIGDRSLLLESSGLWWVTSWVDDGGLVEGPQLVRRGQFYYLFFASGRYCRPDYAQGVARSTNVLGPYEKLRVPLLSTAMVGQDDTGTHLEGPGHAAFVRDADGQWYVIWHAAAQGTAYQHEGGWWECDRKAWVDRMDWTDDGWPYVSFAPQGWDDGTAATATTTTTTTTTTPTTTTPPTTTTTMPTTTTTTLPTTTTTTTTTTTLSNEREGEGAKENESQYTSSARAMFAPLLATLFVSVLHGLIS